MVIGGSSDSATLIISIVLPAAAGIAAIVGAILFIINKRKNKLKTLGKPDFAAIAFGNESKELSEEITPQKREILNQLENVRNGS